MSETLLPTAAKDGEGMKKILNYCYPYRWGMLWGLTMKMTGAMAELVLPWVLSYMIDKVIPQKSVNKIILFGFLMLACTVAACILNITANRKASKVSRDCLLYTSRCV